MRTTTKDGIELAVLERAVVKGTHGYKWALWRVVKKGKGALSVYVAEAMNRGVAFNAKTLREIRTLLPQVHSAVIDGEVPECCYKTPRRVAAEEKTEQERLAARSYDERLADADHEMVGVLESAAAMHERFVAEWIARAAENLHDALESVGTRGAYSVMAAHYRRVLDGADAATRLKLLRGLYRHSRRALLENQYRQNCTSPFVNAMADEKRDAARKMMELIEGLFDRYEAKGIEVD